MAIVTEPELRQVQTATGRLAVASWGAPELPTVLLLHGLRDHARSWDWTAAALLGRYHILAPDLRGHGLSDHFGSYDIADYVRDIAAVADALAPPRFAIVAHSLGGLIGLRYAAAFPERVGAFCGIECIELPIVRDQRAAPKSYPRRLRDWIEAERRDAERAVRSYPSIAAAEQRMADANPRLDAVAVAHLARHATTVADGALRWKYDEATRRRAPDDADGRDLDATLAAIACPVLLLYGEESWIPMPPSDRLALLRDHAVKRFPDASHWLHHEQRDRFLATVRTFLSSHRDILSHA